jgi:hypothetical protein
MTWDELADEIRHGGRLIVYHYCISVGILTFLRPSRIHLVRHGESALARSWGYTLLSLVAGWWGVPWGFVFTPLAVDRNVSGGLDVTDNVVGHLLEESWLNRTRQQARHTADDPPSQNSSRREPAADSGR